MYIGFSLPHPGTPSLPHSHIFLFAILLLAGCSGSRSATVVEPREPTFEEKLAQLPATETFDESAYPAEVPVQNVEIEHDVPAELMEGVAGAGLNSQRRGYRIQVAFAREKLTADQAVEDIHSWLRRMRAENPQVEVFRSNIPVHNIYLQPYFRVRIGDFKTREEAEELLNQMIEEYPRAFIVVDRVTVDN